MAILTLIKAHDDALADLWAALNAGQTHVRGLELEVDRLRDAIIAAEPSTAGELADKLAFVQRLVTEDYDANHPCSTWFASLRRDVLRLFGRP
jgi:hypothetical protein